MFMYYSPDPVFEQSRPRATLERRASSPAYQTSASYSTASLKLPSDKSKEPSRDSVNRIPEALKQLLVDLEDPFAPSPVIRAPQSAPASRRSSARRKHSDLPPIKPPPTIPIPRLPRPPPSPEVQRILSQPTLLSRPTHPRRPSNGEPVPSPISIASSSATLVEGSLHKFELPSPVSSIKAKPTRARSRSNASDVPSSQDKVRPRETSLPMNLPPIPPLRIDTRLSGVPSQMAEARRKSAASTPTTRPLGAAIDDAWVIAQARSIREGWGEELQHGEIRQDRPASHSQGQRSPSTRRSVSSTHSAASQNVTTTYPISPSVVSLPRTSTERSPISPTSPREAKSGNHPTDVQRILSQPTLLHRRPTSRPPSHSTTESVSPTHSTTHSISSDGPPPSSFRTQPIRSPKDVETPTRARSKSRDSKAASRDIERRRDMQRASGDQASPEKRGRLWKGVSLGLIR